MSVTAPTPISALPTPPSTSDAANFDARADAFLGALPTMTTETNAVATNVFNNATDAATNAANAAASAATATAIGNFKGNWADLTGALNVPATVLHSGVYWQLLSNLVNVTTATPGVSGAWTQMTPVPIASGGTGATTAAAARTALNVNQFQHLDGLALSNTAGTSSMTVAPGVAMDSTEAFLMVLAAAITKTSGSWAVGSATGGLDTGTFATPNQYTFFLIRRPDTGVVDVCFSLSNSAPTFGSHIPAAYTQYRRIGAAFVVAGTYTPFRQTGDYFILETPQSVYSAAPGAGSGLLTVTVPTGIKARALLSAAAVGNDYIRLSDPDQPDMAVTASNAQIQTNTTGGSVECFTNTSGQIRRRCNSGAGILTILSHGWVDARGRS